MANRYLQVRDFKWGLESRKSELLTQAGALAELINGHINSGGEIEQRQSFVKSAIGYQSWQFGLEATDQGLVTFGSKGTSSTVSTIQRAGGVAFLTVATPHQLNVGDLIDVTGVGSGFDVVGAVVNGITPTIVQYANPGSNTGPSAHGGTITTPYAPTGVTYQQLSTGAASALTTAVLNGVIFSCNFNGKAFVIASYTGLNRYYCFYNGALVEPSGFGLAEAASGQTLSNLAVWLAENINKLTGWVADPNVTNNANADSSGYHETLANGTVLAMSPPGISFTPTVSKVSTNGLFGATQRDSNYGGVHAAAASVSFTITGAVGGNIDVTAPLNSDGTGTVDLTGGNVVSAVNLNNTAALVVAAINNNTYLTGYSASSNGTNGVTVYAPISWGNVAYNVTVVTTGTITTGAGGGSVATTISPSYLNVVKVVSRGGATASGSATAVVSGATGIVTYAWVEVHADGSPIGGDATGVKVNGGTTAATASVTFAYSFTAQGSKDSYWKVTASDVGTGTNASAQIWVHLEVDNTF